MNSIRKIHLNGFWNRKKFKRKSKQNCQKKFANKSRYQSKPLTKVGGFFMCIVMLGCDIIHKKAY